MSLAVQRVVPKGFNILTPSIPAKYRITQTIIEDAICNPVGPAQYIFGEKLDAFQKLRLKISWACPRVMDTSGFSSAKTKNMWMASVLRALIFWDHIGAVYYQNFSNGQLIYFRYFNEVAGRSPVFRAQIGRRRIVGLDGSEAGDSKAVGKGPSCWTVDFKNDSQILMPAPGFLTNAKGQAGLRFNDLYIDEWTKIEATGTTGIDDQLIGRTTRHCWNKNHPIFCNHHLFLATAEDVSHPGYSRFLAYETEVRKGNPDYFIYTGSYKDYSNLEYKNGATFRDIFREERAIEDLRKRKSRNGFLQEAFGIWSRNGRGWYTADMMVKGYTLGKSWGINIILSRREDPRPDKAFYFMGVDPAKAETAKAADGSLVVVRAELINPDYCNEIGGYNASVCYAHLVRRADVGQWSGIIHRLHQRFNLSKICMDPGGGGIWIQPELKKVMQRIRGIETRCRPIATVEDERSTMIEGDFNLMMFRLGDTLVNRTWENMQMKKADNLNETAHVEMQEGLRMGIGLPCPHHLRTNAEIQDWSPERKWANVLVDQYVKQLLKINVLTNPDGTAVYTAQGARQFTCRGKKDFAMAGIMAWTAFLAWVKAQDNTKIPEDQMAMCGGGEC